MAKYFPGQLGLVKGKVGNLIISNWRGIPYIKSKGKKTWKKPSKELRGTRTSFKFINEWLMQIHGIVMIGFKNYDPKHTGRNSAHSYNSTHAVIETEDGYEIDHSKFLFSYGNLHFPKEAKAVIVDEARIEITWSTELEGEAEPTDILLYIVFFPESDITISMVGAASRKDGKVDAFLPAAQRFERVEVHMAFKSSLSDTVSMSKHLGNLNAVELTEEQAQAANFCIPAVVSGSLFSSMRK